jgi:DNA polymerase III gamma/tau subunit
MRDAISLLDQLLSYGDEVLELARVERVLGLVNPQTIGQLVGCVAENDAPTGLALINRLVADGVEMGLLADQIIAYLRAVLFVRVTGAHDLLDLPADVVAAVGRLAEKMTPDTILSGVREFVLARGTLRDQVPGVPQLPLEIAFLRSALPPGLVSPQTVPDVGAAVQPTATRRAPDQKPVTEPAAELVPASTGPNPIPDEASAPATSKPGNDPVEGPSTVVLLQDAQAAWDRFLNMAGKRCGMKVQAALRSVRGIEVVGQTLVLQFAHAFSRDLVGADENLRPVEALWENLLGRKVPVRCAVVGEKITPPTASPDEPSTQTPGGEDESLLDSARELGAVVKHLG